jgi:hypothetical protein
MSWTKVTVQIAAITRFVLKSNALNLKWTRRSLVTSLVLKYDALNSSRKYADRCITSLALEYEPPNNDSERFIYLPSKLPYYTNLNAQC